MEKFRVLGNGMLIGPQPTEEDLQQAKQQGIKTVIDFRMPEELTTSNAELVAKNGLDYANLPVNKANLSENQIEELDRIMQEKEGPFLVHCASGTRAAMFLALSQAKKHQWDAERTLDESKAMGYDLREFPEFERFVYEATSR